MKFLWYLCFSIVLCLFLNSVFENKTEEARRVEKINHQFKEVFFETKDYYLLNNILNPEEKQKVISKLNENTPENKEKIFENLILEKSEEIKNIGNYQKEEWKKSFEEDKENKELLNKIINFHNTWIFRTIVLIIVFLFGILFFLRPPRRI